MTAFFMQFCKKISIALALLVTTIFAYADEGSIAVKHASVKQEAGLYMLNSDLEMVLSAEIKEAIDKGVPVEFLYEFTLYKTRRYWFDKELATINTSITVSYHALSRQYLVNHDGRQTSHEILREAMIELVQLYDWPVFDQALIEAGETYEATLNVKLDKAQLPKAIQVDSINTEAWTLVAEPYHWVLEKTNK